MPVVRRLVGRLVGPLVWGQTYRRYVHLLLGAVLLLPYPALVWLFVDSVAKGELDLLTMVVLLVPATVGGIAVALVPGVRALEVTAARALLDTDVPDPEPDAARSWPARGRGAVWLVINMVLGGTIALLTLIALPTAALLLLAPWRDWPPLPGWASAGWAAAWAPPAGVVCLLALGHVVAVAGRWLARLAPRLLGPTPHELLLAELAAAHRAADELTERDRLATELHDSVGHSLTITTLQSAAAARVLDSDPDFARHALTMIEETGRTALAELDHMLGLVRNGVDGRLQRRPQPDLAELNRLLDRARTAGMRVDAELTGDLAALPAAVSRAGYRILQEAMTNAARHAGSAPVTVRVTVRPDELTLTVSNPLRGSTEHRAARRGSGLAGMSDRIRVLRGELHTGPDGSRWLVDARLPLAGRAGQT